LNQEDINNLNRSITSNEIWIAIKKLPKKNSPGLEGFTTEFYQTLKEKLTPLLLKLSYYIQKERILPDSLYKVNITLIPKPDKDTSKTEKVIAQYPC
jgi:hypothetical protein